jgi:hypothetical protein
MRKYLVVLVAALALVAFSMPAGAVDIGASGFYHGFAIMSNFSGYNGNSSEGNLVNSDEEATAAFLAQRFRVKWTFGNENVKAIWYLESDMVWGDSAGGGGGGQATCTRNSGGALGGDCVQTETKQIHVWFKIPNTSMEGTVGTQTVGDDYSGVFNANNDMAAITIKGKYEPVSYKFSFAKLYEHVRYESDDATLWVGGVAFNPNKESKLGVNFYFLQDQGSGFNVDIGNRNAKIYMPGIDGSIKLGPATVSGWVFYQTGTLDSQVPGGNDRDVSGWAANLRGDINVGPGKAFLEGLYISGDDKADQDDENFDSIITLGGYNQSPTGYDGYTKPHMVLMFSTWNMATISQCLIGCSAATFGRSMNNEGRGLWFVGAGYNQKFTDNIKGEINVGHAEANNLFDADNLRDRGKELGTEVNATVTLGVQKGLNFSVTGAYVFLGDFAKVAETGGGFTTAQDIYTTYAELNYSF